MSNLIRSGVAALVIACASVAVAETVAVQNSGDSFTAGGQISETVPGGGDAFVAARSANVSGAAQADLHVAGFDVLVSADTAGDLYAIGANVMIRGNTAQDLTAAGFSVRTERGAQTQGNARLIGNTVTLEGPVAGGVAVAGRDVIINAAIRGDLRILAQSLSFGPDATVSGRLTYSTQDRTPVPERVAASDRVVFEPVDASSMWGEWDEWEDISREMPVLPGFAAVVSGFVISLLFFVVLGALMLGFMPKRLSKLRRSIAAAPGQTLLLGVIGLSMLFGMVPIVGLTIVGLPFVPIVLLAIVVVWTLGYALGAYSVAMRVWVAMGQDEMPGSVTRLLVFAAAIFLIALLNFIPFVGWVANYTLVLLGIGAMTNALFQYLIGNAGVALDVDMQGPQE
jgi:hypothetical protein